jgi:hypothetical protein
MTCSLRPRHLISKAACGVITYSVIGSKASGTIVPPNRKPSVCEVGSLPLVRIQDVSSEGQHYSDGTTMRLGAREEIGALPPLRVPP